MPRRGPHNSNITWLPYVRVAWGGKLGLGAEVWTNSMKYLPDTNTPITPSQALACMGNVYGALAGWVEAASSAISKDVLLTWLKINSVNGDGLQYNSDTNIMEGSPHIGGGGESNFVPYHTSFAISFTTALKRGRAHIGRIYPPAVNAPVIYNTGMQNVTSAQAQAASFTTCLNAMNSAMRSGFAPGSFAVLSPGNALKGTVPISAKISGCFVDTVPDTQHRRTNRLKGVRSTVTTITP